MKSDSTTAGKAGGTKILLIEDSEDFRSKMRSLLETLDYEVLEASDGLEGIDVMKSQEEIGLVISDLHMPNLDGLSMCKKLKDDNINSDALILMVTTEANPKLKRKGSDAGIYKWLLKPISDKKFLSMIKKIISKLPNMKENAA